MDVNEIRADLVHELGCKLDDMLEAAKFDGMRDEGAKMALQLSVKKIDELSLLVDKELDSDGFANLEEPLQIAKAIKKYLIKAHEILELGAAQAEQHRLVSQGRIQAYELMVGNMKRIHDMERGKAALRKAATISEETSSEIAVRAPAPVGHPGMTLKERRKLEDAETASNASQETPAPEPTEVPQPEEPSSEPLNEKKRRGRPPKQR